MTERKRKRWAAAKKELQQLGILPPDKKRVNRKALLRQAENAWQGLDTIGDLAYLQWAIGEMLGKKEYPAGTVSPEAVGVAKVLLLAAKRKAWEAQRWAEGKPSTYKLGELMEAVLPIYDM